MLDHELRAVVTEIGAVYVDILPDFRDIPNSERYYLAVDGHPNAAGHALLAGMLSKELTSGAIPALSAAPRMLPTREARR
jgi:lysophospholipase L1-like esterase